MEKSMLRACVTYIFVYAFEGVIECAISMVICEDADILEQIVVTIIVIAVIWIYHFFIGRKLDREILQLPLPLWECWALFCYSCF